MLSSNHISILEEVQPSWLRLNPNEIFIGQGQFSASLTDTPKNQWIVKTVTDDQVSYYAKLGYSRIKLDRAHVENAIKLMKEPDDSGIALFSNINGKQPMPKSLIDVLATTDNPSVYSPTKVHLIVDIDNNGMVVTKSWVNELISLPRAADRTSNILPTVGWDNSDYAIPSDKKQFLAWKNLLLHGDVSIKKDYTRKLQNKLDLSDTAVLAFVRFLESDQLVDISDKPKSLLKPKVCYRHAESRKIIAQCDSVIKMAAELLGDMSEIISQSPMMALYGNTVRLFNTPTETNISYGIVPMMQRGILLSAFDNFQAIKDRIITMGHLGVIIYREDEIKTPLDSIFKQLISEQSQDDINNDYLRFLDYQAQVAQYKVIVLDLRSKGSVASLLAVSISEADLYQYLKRSVNLLATKSVHRPISFEKLIQNPKPYSTTRSLSLINYVIGLSDVIPYQFKQDVKKAIVNDDNDFLFYMRKHFLKMLY